MAGIHFRHVWNIGAYPQLVVVKTAFPKALWKGCTTTTENLVILFHLMLRSAFPPSSVSQSSQYLRDLRTFPVLGIFPLWTVVVSYECSHMPCDIIAMLPTGHGMLASPLKCTNPRTPGTLDAMFHRCISPVTENIAWASCWAGSTIQKEGQWSGFRTKSLQSQAVLQPAFRPIHISLLRWGTSEGTPRLRMFSGEFYRLCTWAQFFSECWVPGAMLVLTLHEKEVQS